jgi:hypothetical protein
VPDWVIALLNTKKPHFCGFLVFCGETGIRTLDTL